MEFSVEVNLKPFMTQWSLIQPSAVSPLTGRLTPVYGTGRPRVLLFCSKIETDIKSKTIDSLPASRKIDP